MTTYRKITEELIALGGNERRAFDFENLYPVEKGISYNSYLILDEKTVLLDTVDKEVSEAFVENLIKALDGRKLDYLVINHMEPDHCATIPQVTRIYPEVQVVGNAKTFAMIKQFYNLDLSDRAIVVKDKATLEIGKRTLQFIFAPFVHWPEVMVTYVEYDKTLFSADAFGTFGALNGELYADEIDFERDYIDEARRYYTNIVGKYGSFVNTLLKKAGTLEIERICPLHGPIFRKDLGKILEKYSKWATYEAEESGVVIPYGSIYGNTEAAADYFATKLNEKGVKNVRLFDVSSTHFSYILSECFKYDKIVFFVPTYNAEIFPYMDLLLKELHIHNLQNRRFGIVENGTWAPTALKQTRAILEGMKCCPIYENTVTIKSAMSEENKLQLEALAEEIANS